jgi:3-hydroxyacyl-[acyl-carrier-protein] dehydratase
MRPVRDLLPHRAPFALLDRVLSADAARVVGEKRVSADDALLGDAGLGGPLLVEALAQTAACLMGLANPGRTGHRGYLVAARGWKFPSRAAAGETVTLEATRVSALGALHGFEGRAHVDGRELASGSLTFAVTFDDGAGGSDGNG